MLEEMAGLIKQDLKPSSSSDEEEKKKGEESDDEDDDEDFGTDRDINWKDAS